MAVKLGEKDVERIQARLPGGYDAKELRFVVARAQLQPSTEPDDFERAVLAGLDTKKGGPPMITDGKPTIMRVVAWMCHDGVNRNRDAFVGEELKAAATTLFRAPDFGVMDFNHSAVIPWDTDNPKVLGVWYKAEYAFDQKAQGGKGAWGILATGMMFAWAFPEYANALLGEQSREGFLNFSMACFPGGVEFMQDSEGTYAVLHNPVFFTLSALDIPPADPDATGIATEEPVGEDELRRRVAATVEVQMDKELEAKLLADKAAAENRATEAEGKATAADAARVAAEAKVAELETRVAEVETARNALVTEMAALKESNTALEAKVSELAAQVEQYRKAEAEQARKALLASRLESLPEAFLKAHAARAPEMRARLEEKWAGMSDTEWEEYKTNELLGYVPAARVGFRLRSEIEGALPGAGTSAGEGLAARAASLKK